MNNHSSTTATAGIELADEEMLTYAVSDEALEAAGGRQLARIMHRWGDFVTAVARSQRFP